MKALSLWQPWASLIAIGAKQYETRSWGTPYRGPLVIHAAKRPAEFHREGARLLIKAGYKTLDSLPLGCALCLVELVDCIKMTPALIDSISYTEFGFGDWKEGRYAWKLTNPRPFDKPIPMRGMQGLFDCTLPG